MLLLTRARWPQPIALLHWGQGCIDPNISRIQFYPPSGKQRFLLANLGLNTESSIPLPRQIFSVPTQSRDKNRARYSHSHGFLGMKTWLNEKVYKGFRNNLDMAFLPFLKFKIIFTNNKVTALWKSVKLGKLKKNILPKRVITWSKIVRF